MSVQFAFSENSSNMLFSLRLVLSVKLGGTPQTGAWVKMDSSTLSLQSMMRSPLDKTAHPSYGPWSQDKVKITSPSYDDVANSGDAYFENVSQHFLLQSCSNTTALQLPVLSSGLWTNRLAWTQRAQSLPEDLFRRKPGVKMCLHLKHRISETGTENGLFSAAWPQFPVSDISFQFLYTCSCCILCT